VAAGLSLAVIGIATQLGVFTAYAVVLLSPMVYVFARLHRQTPDARTTSDLVAAVLGERFGVFAGLIQLVAYLVMGAKFARLVAVDLLGPFLVVDPSAPIGWFAVGSIAAVVAAGIVIYLLSTRGIARVAAILAAVGMLVYFYLALAVVTLIAAGNKPRDYSISMPATPYVSYGLADVLLAVLVVVGFEVVTAANRDVRSVGRSMGLAFALTAGVAVTVAAAVSPRLFRSIQMPSDVQFPSLVGAYLGNAGAWLLIGNLAFGCAALLMLTFGAVRVAQRLAEQFDVPLQEGARLAGVVGVVGVLVIVEWLWSGLAASKLVDVGPLLLLAVYACAAHACARIQTAQPRIAAEAARLFMWALVAGIVVIALARSRSDPAEWWPVGIAGGVLLAAAAIAAKTERLLRTSEAREE
jgi:hypothetical protein